MELVTKTPLVNLKGEELKHENQQLTVGSAIADALVGPHLECKNPIEAAERYGLAVKIRSSDVVKITSEQVTLCKKAVCASFAPIVSGQVCTLIEQ